MVSRKNIADIIPGVVRLDECLPYILQTMTRYHIDNTPQRVGAFLAQVAHESDRFRAFKEYASGKQYEGRDDLGNTEPGDGVRFKGRGAIQTTGRKNYLSLGNRLGVGDHFVRFPDELELPAYAFLSAGDYWDSRGLNGVADEPEDYVHPGVHAYSKFQWITVNINGGLNGFDSRLKFYNNARKVLGF